MKTITTAAVKGGTGKTTTAAALAQAAAADGKKVLAIDLDPQGNLSFALGADQSRSGTYQLLHGAPIAATMQTTAQGITVIPASPNLAAEKTIRDSAKRLAAALEPIRKDFDYCFVDVPPTMGELQYNALQAADILLIPLEADSFAVTGLQHIVSIAKQFQQSSNPGLRIGGTILTRYNSMAKICRLLRISIAATGERIGAPLVMTIRRGIAIQEAQALRKSLYKYAPKSKPAADYMELYRQITGEL